LQESISRQEVPEALAVLSELVPEWQRAPVGEGVAATEA